MTTMAIDVGATCDCGGPIRARNMCGVCYMRAYQRARYAPVPRSLWATTIHPKTAHWRCWRLWGPASDHACIECRGPAQEWAYDGTDDSALYRNADGRWVLFSRFPEFYMPMCQPCHRRRDQAAIAAIVHAYRLRLFGGDA